MAFWHKSEDPWDREPERRTAPVETEPADDGAAPAPLEGVRDRLRQAKAAALGEEEAPPTETCPWCGAPMMLGYLSGGNGVRFSQTRPGALMGASFVNPRVDNEGGVLNRYKIAWYCLTCRRMVMRMAGWDWDRSGGPFAPPDFPETEREQTEENR